MLLRKQASQRIAARYSTIRLIASVSFSTSKQILYVQSCYKRESMTMDSLTGKLEASEKDVPTLQTPIKRPQQHDRTSEYVAAQLDFTGPLSKDFLKVNLPLVPSSIISFSTLPELHTEKRVTNIILSATSTHLAHGGSFRTKSAPPRRPL